MKPKPVISNATEHSFEMDLRIVGDDENEETILCWYHALGLVQVLIFIPAIEYHDLAYRFPAIHLAHI